MGLTGPPNGSIMMQRYQNNLFRGQPEQMVFNQERVFYNFELLPDRIVLDTFNGVNWAIMAASPQGIKLQTAGSYFSNKGRDIVLGFLDTDRSRLFNLSPKDSTTR